MRRLLELRRGAAGARAAIRRFAAAPDAGFSLIEILFAMVFLAVGLLAVAGMIPLATHQIASAKAVTDATATAQARLEELRGEDFLSSDLAAGAYSDTVGRYNLDWTIQDNVPVPGSKRIDMSVSWTTSSGTETTDLSTFVTR